MVYKSGKYQVIFATLDKNSGCGVQAVLLFDKDYHTLIDGYNTFCIKADETLAKNDGLSLEDFKAWFKGADLSEPMAIIHFTPFRY